MQVEPFKPTLKVPGTKRLKLKSNEPLSSFAFEFNLHRYNKVAFDYQVLEGDEANWTVKPADGVYCFGMYLDGCAWDANGGIEEEGGAEGGGGGGGSLCESEAKVLYAPAPGIHMIPAQTKDFKAGAYTRSCQIST